MLTCIEQHFHTVRVFLWTSHMQWGPVIYVVRLQTSIHGNQEFHTVRVSWNVTRKYCHGSFFTGGLLIPLKLNHVLRELWHSPPIQASWRGEAVREVRAELALAPWSRRSLTHSKLPAEQASHSGVLPSTFLTSTWDASYQHMIIYSRWQDKLVGLSKS